MTNRHTFLFVSVIVLLAFAFACRLGAPTEQATEVLEGLTSVLSTATATPEAEGTPVAPAATPTPEPAAPAANAPLSGAGSGLDITDIVQVTDVLFFETGYDLTDYEDRVYDVVFDSSTARYIAWELNLEYAQPGRRLHFDIEAIWYGPDGDIVAEDTFEDAYIDADWTSSFHAKGYGSEEPRREPGEYTVELHVDNELMASASFEIAGEATDRPPDAVDLGISPSGRIAFGSERDGNRDIYVINADGTDQLRLTDHPAWDDYAAWSPDGTQIAFTSDRDGNSEIYVIDADGSGLTRLTSSPDYFEASPEWSPDGERIAFLTSRGGDENHDNIYVMNADGGEPTKLTNVLTDEWKFSWSPDSSMIVYSSYSDSYGIYLMQADGSGKTVLLEDPYADLLDPAWSPDGEYIAFTATPSTANGRIDVVRPDGSDPFTLTEHWSGDAAPTWSPDGNWLAFTSYRDGEGNIYVMPAPGSPAEGSEPINVTDSPYDEGWAAWSPQLTDTPSSAPTFTFSTPTPSRPDYGIAEMVYVSDFLFFESGFDTPPYEDRVYATRLARDSTRYVNWELNIDYPEPGDRVYFDIDAVLYGPDDDVLAELTFDDVYLDADWTGSYHSMGYGWREPGHWDSGEYTVDLYVQDEWLAGGTFEIVEAE